MEGDSRNGDGKPMPTIRHSESSAPNDDNNAAETSAAAAHAEPQQEELPANAENTQMPLEGLSKNAQKRLLKRAKHDETKKDRRREAKERKRAKKAEEKEQQQQQAIDHADGLASGSSSGLKKSNGIGAESGERIRDKNAERERDQKPFGAGLVIDLGFDEVMSERECASMAVQLTYLYASNKSSRMPMSNITLVGRGKDKDCFEYSTTTSAELQSPHPSFFVHHRMLEAAAERAAAPTDSSGQDNQTGEGRLLLRRSRIGHMKETQDGGSWNRWQRITIQDQGGLESLVAGRESDYVYLSADAEDVITELDEGKHYIIGGLVDRNRYKNICLNKANALKIPAARLPLNEAQLGGKKVLAVNHVVDILLAWIETRNWDSAVEKGLPGRRAKLENGMQPESVQRRRGKRERAQNGPQDEKDKEANSPHVDDMSIDELDEEEAFNSSSRLSQ